MFKKSLLSDILAGLTVSFAAISLGAAFGTLSGRGAFAGMIAAAVIPIFTSLLGGTRLQASGPTAPLTAISALVIAFAYENFQGNKEMAEQFISLVLLMNALFLIIAGILRLGKFIALIPQVVVLGFMNGIAVLIWVDQLERLFGFGASESPLEGGIIINTCLAFGTLGMIFLIPMLAKKFKISNNVRLFFPPIIITIIFMTLVSTGFNLNLETVQLGNSIDSLSEYAGLMVSYLPSLEMFTFDMMLKALPFALQLTMLSYLDSLLTSLVVDNLVKEKTNKEKELIAQGAANGVSALFLGIPGAQATIRSVLLVKEGAKTRLAGVLVGVFALLTFVFFKDYISMVASAVFIGVLFKAGIDVLDRDFIYFYFKNKWKDSRKRNIQLLIILYTTVVTVVLDLNIAVISGTVLFYIVKKLFNAIDAEVNISNVSEKEEEYATG